MRKIWGAAGLAGLALTVSACASSSSSTATTSSTPAAAGSSAAAAGSSAAAAGSSAAAGGTTLDVHTMSGQQVVTNSKGFTLYWFAPDTSTKSACYGSCAAYWPPVTGTPSAGPGVTGTLGTITRTDGTKQATYDGHPLYTYIADSAPGSASGNNINLNGGLWHDVPITG